MDVYCYNLHPRWKGVVVGDISARLQLPAMYAATGTLLHDPRAGMIGSEVAMEQVRRCFVNHPLAGGDEKQLRVIMALSGLNPALALVCGDLMKSSEELAFLHTMEPKEKVSNESAWVSDLSEAATAYIGEYDSLPPNVRRGLTGNEERRALGFGRQVARISCVRGGHVLSEPGSVEIPNSPVTPGQVKVLEEKLRGLTNVMTCTVDGAQAGTTGAGTAYPLTIPDGADEVTKEVHAELKKSSDAHQETVEK